MENNKIATGSSFFYGGVEKGKYNSNKKYA
jgi:hypothetical protein